MGNTSPKDTNIHVAFCFAEGKNKNYIKYLAVTICQMLTKASVNNKYFIHVVSEKDLSEFFKYIYIYIEKYLNKKINFVLQQI
jgi:hypothetical protein